LIEMMIIAIKWREMYEEFVPQYKEQIKGIGKELEKISQDSSNLEKHLQTTLQGAANLVSTWKILDYTERQRLQYLIFPKGMFYDRKKKMRLEPMK